MVGHRQPDRPTISSSHDDDSLDAGLSQAIRSASILSLFTGADGIIRRGTLVAPERPGELASRLDGTRIDVLFGPGERALIQLLLAKAREAPQFRFSNLLMRLAGEQAPQRHVSLVVVESGDPDTALLVWRLSANEQLNADQDSVERALRGRIEALAARCQVHQAASEQARRSLETVRGVNRTLTSSLHQVRLLRDQQTEALRKSNEAKGEYIERVRKAWQSAQEARRVAEEGRQRLLFIADASQSISESLDVNVVLQRVADLTVPDIADCCMIDLVNEETGEFRRAVTTCRDSTLTERIKADADCDLNDAGIEHPVRTALNEARTIVVHDLSDIVSQAGDEESTLSAWLRALGLSSCIFTVLRARGRVFGVMTFAITDPNRRFHPDDLIIAEDVTHRVAHALDNALLYQRAEEARKERDRYLSVASHELRSPLTVVSGFGALMLRQLRSPEPDSARLLMLGEELQRGVERLEALTDGLLTSSSIEQGFPNAGITKLDLTALVETLLVDIRTTSLAGEDRRIIFDAPTSVIGHWNGPSLERAFSNVLSNALKYSPGDEDVIVRIALEDDMVSIQVMDRGIGMSEEEQSRLFSPFVRGKAARKTAAGTGLGLYITKQIVDRHGGEVAIESTAGAGSTVTIRLPLNSSPPAVQRAD